jgi:DNA-binding transcriptional ArsR family regulator
LANNQKRITAIFAALADPTRRRIMERLSHREESRVTALARPFPMSLPSFSRHLRVLERARLVERRRDGRLHLIRARTAGLKEAQKWMAHFAAGWNYSFDALDQLIKNEKQKEDGR